MTSKKALDNLSGLVNLDLCDLDEINTYVEIIEKDLELLEKYRDLVREYASIQGRNLTVSIEEVVKDFRELENNKNI